jgi:1-phosphofructokinase family hexose kinase
MNPDASILTLTVNPAVDRIITVDRLVFEARAYILSTTEAAGGRGVNAARVLKNFGAKVVAILPSGGEVGKTLEEKLGHDDFEADVVPIAANVRTNLAITDKQGLSVKLNEQGPPISKSELKAILKTVEHRLQSASWLMLCGSLPPTVDRHFYSLLIESANSHGVQTLLDADGDALLHAIEAGPSLTSPNQSEAERLLNRPLITRTHFIDAAKHVRAMGAKSVLLSLGSRGAIGASPAGLIEVIPPRIEALCPIGAGDALAAATVWALAQGKRFDEAVRWGVAAGTASAKLPGISLATFKETEAIFDETVVQEISE